MDLNVYSPSTIPSLTASLVTTTEMHSAYIQLVEYCRYCSSPGDFYLTYLLVLVLRATGWTCKNWTWLNAMQVFTAVLPCLVSTRTKLDTYHLLPMAYSSHPSPTAQSKVSKSWHVLGSFYRTRPKHQTDQPTAAIPRSWLVSAKEITGLLTRVSFVVLTVLTMCPDVAQPQTLSTSTELTVVMQPKINHMRHTCCLIHWRQGNSSTVVQYHRGQLYLSFDRPTMFTS